MHSLVHKSACILTLGLCVLAGPLAMASSPVHQHVLFTSRAEVAVSGISRAAGDKACVDAIHRASESARLQAEQKLRSIASISPHEARDFRLALKHARAIPSECHCLDRDGVFNINHPLFCSVTVALTDRYLNRTDMINGMMNDLQHIHSDTRND